MKGLNSEAEFDVTSFLPGDSPGVQWRVYRYSEGAWWYDGSLPAGIFAPGATEIGEAFGAGRYLLLATRAYLERTVVAETSYSFAESS